MHVIQDSTWRGILKIFWFSESTKCPSLTLDAKNLKSRGLTQKRALLQRQQACRALAVSFCRPTGGWPKYYCRIETLQFFFFYRVRSSTAPCLGNKTVQVWSTLLLPAPSAAAPAALLHTHTSSLHKANGNGWQVSLFWHPHFSVFRDPRLHGNNKQSCCTELGTAWWSGLDFSSFPTFFSSAAVPPVPSSQRAPSDPESPTVKADGIRPHVAWQNHGPLVSFPSFPYVSALLLCVRACVRAFARDWADLPFFAGRQADRRARKAAPGR